MDSFCTTTEIIPIRASVHRHVQIGFVYTLVQRGLEPSKTKGNIQE